MPRPVYLPEVLASYACQRTGVCCHAPFRAHVGTVELVGIRALVSASESAETQGPRLEAGLGMDRGESRVLEQRGGCCTLLDDPMGCSLQSAAGLDALPTICRTFPRSVLATPRGTEVAFVLSCPTAAGIVARQPRPFAWTTAGADWAYPATRRLAGRPHLDYGKQITFEELDALRSGWWAVLAEAPTDEEHLLAVLWHLTTHPQTPNGEALTAAHAGWAGLPRAMAKLVTQAAARVPARGQTYAAAEEPILAVLTEPVPLDQLAKFLPGSAAALSCATGLGVQLVCGHVIATFTHGLRVAAWQAIVSGVLFAALRSVVGDADPDTTLADALCIGAQVGAEGLLSTPELLP